MNKIVFHKPISKRFINIVLTALWLIVLTIAGVGQSSYTDIYESGSSVIAYGQMSGTYMMGSHIDSTNISLYGPSGSALGSGGNSASASLPIGTGGTFNAYTSHDSYCPESNTTYYGVAYSSASITVGGGGGQTCTDTCTPCREQRQPKEIACAATLATCEAQAFNVYNNAMTQCDNNNYCNPNHPAYNQEQCDNCRSTANENYTISIASCVAGWVGCRALITPDCDPHPTYQKADCSACNNWPPW